jgi:hypothetical protein
VHPLFFSGQPLPVLGIGTVEIPTKRSPNQSGTACHGSLLLKEVLHVPDFTCNVLGDPLWESDGYDVTTLTTSSSRGSIVDRHGKRVAYFDPKQPLFCIKMRYVPTGPRLGRSVLEKGAIYMLSCTWDDTERQKWLDLKAQNGSNGPPTADTNPPYTAAETAFLKKGWRNEFYFLNLHGLKIHSEEDRAEGRSLLRALMHHDFSDDADSFSEDVEDDEFDYEGHQADYNFSDGQLGWIEKYYGNSETFMVSYGLKFYDNDDVEEAKAIISAMMAQDE